MLKIISPILIIIISSIILSAGEADTVIIPSDSTVIIDSLEITGNDITEEYIILREMTIDAGDTVNNKIIEFNRERIYSLGLFNFVDLHIEQDGDLNILVIDVDEGWYIWPIKRAAQHSVNT